MSKKTKEVELLYAELFSFRKESLPKSNSAPVGLRTSFLLRLERMGKKIEKSFRWKVS